MNATMLISELFRAILRRLALLLAILAAGLLALAWMSKAEALAHDIYGGWHNKLGQDCCQGMHCRVYPAANVHFAPGGYLLDDGVFVPFADVLGSPDEDYHRCDLAGQKARCFAVPGSG
jgi:acetyltransferase-like isoleucine patch superfamily enzyme